MVRVMPKLVPQTMVKCSMYAHAHILAAYEMCDLRRLRRWGVRHVYLTRDTRDALTSLLPIIE